MNSRKKGHCIKGTVSLCNKLFLISTHLLDINFCANNNCSKVVILNKSKTDIRRHFTRIDMGWRPLWHMYVYGFTRARAFIPLEGATLSQ